MKQNSKFYACPECGVLVGLIKGDARKLTCCSTPLVEVPLHTEYDSKHTPVYTRVEDEIYVSISHPMTKDHYIEWIALMTDTKTVRVQLYPEQNAEARLPYIPRSTIYAYCNLHGLWTAPVK